MKSLLETIHTKFPEDSAWNVLWMLSYQCGIEEVQNALDEIKVLFHESGRRSIMIDITKIPEEKLNNDYRIAHNEREFCEMAMFAGLKEYNGVDLAEQIMKANTIMEKIMSEINRRGLTPRVPDTLDSIASKAVFKASAKFTLEDES